jgi:hypothetical protein
MSKSKLRFTKLVMALALFGVVAIPAQEAGAATSIAPTVALKILLIGGSPNSGDQEPSTTAWEDALTSEGVSYTEVAGAGVYGAETVTLPALTTSATVGNFNGVVLADTDAAFASGQLTPLFTYEADFGIRQVSGYGYPDATRGETAVATPVTTLDNTSGTITAAGLAALPALKGIIPFDTGTYGVEATATSTNFTPWITNSTGILAGVYSHPMTDAQAGVSELLINFDYNNTSLQWLLAAPELINWVTQDTHLGLYRNYFGQDIDDNFIADNQWSNADQCTPAATQPQDYTCSAAVLANSAGWPSDIQMSAADVAYVVAWEQSSGITLNLAFNGVGACSADTVADESSANCSGAITEGTSTYTDPGFSVAAGDTNDQGLINALLADKADFNWINHTWSHAFLGCTDFAPQVLTSVTPSATGGTLAAGTYNYVITAATAYGESEPSTPLVTPITVTGTASSVKLVWPDATNGSGTNGAGQTLAQEEANHTGGTGFWGYNIYRTASGGTTYGLIGSVAELPETATYSFTDIGGTSPGAAPGSNDAYPTATNPGIDCANTSTSWDPASDGGGLLDGSIQDEIGLNQAFAKANSLPNFSNATVVTGEHSGIESPNMPTALQATGITTFAADASRQSTQYSENVGTTPVAESAPRYPSNIYYNAANWPNEINEYNTLYVAQGTAIDPTGYPGEVGHCDNTSSTTCLTTPATEATILASESRIMLSHVLNNDPRVGYAHQTNLISDPVTVGTTTTEEGYTILSLINNMLSQYQAWTSMPLVQMTDTTEATVLGEQAAWATALGTGKVTASEQNGVINVTNTTGATVNAAITAPSGTTVNGAVFGQSYGGAQSAWTSVTASGITMDSSVGVLADGSVLTANEGITSPNGEFSLVMQGDGNLVEYDGATAAWSSGSNTAGSVVEMQTDGNLVIYSGSTYKWQSGTSGNPGAYLVLGDDGVLTIDSASGIPLWGATGVVVPDTTLASNHSITSPNGKYRLTMQSDGNLVEYDGATAAWSSGTSTAGSTVTMQTDGNFVIYSGSTYKWQSGTSGNPGAYLVLTDNGVLGVDSANGVPLWGATGELVPNATLASNHSITSPNGSYRLTMQSDGNLVEYDGATAAWSSGTSTAGSTVTMQNDGNFVIYSGSTYKWQSGTSGNPGAYLVLGDNGVLAVDSFDGIALWTATGALAPNASLATNKSITSANGQYRLTMQSDGNLVEYNGATAKWASDTATAGSSVIMQADGNLVIYSSGVAKWQSGTSGNPGAYLYLADNGVLTIDSSDGLVIWTA